MLAEFLSNDKKQLPFFVESVDDFPHLKLVKLKGDLDTKALGEINQLVKKVKKSSRILDNDYTSAFYILSCSCSIIYNYRTILNCSCRSKRGGAYSRISGC